jgi:hypothetical protein
LLQDLDISQHHPFGNIDILVNGYDTLKPAKGILRRGWGKRESNGGDVPNLVTLYIIWKYHNNFSHTTFIYE